MHQYRPVQQNGYAYAVDFFIFRLLNNKKSERIGNGSQIHRKNERNTTNKKVYARCQPNGTTAILKLLNANPSGCWICNPAEERNRRNNTNQANNSRNTNKKGEWKNDLRIFIDYLVCATVFRVSVIDVVCVHFIRLGPFSACCVCSPNE